MADMTKKRILMALTRFDIGGAETHVLELSLELKRMGYHVVVVSNGGVYEENLQQAGIRHVKIPMHSKTPAKVFQSLRALKKVIQEENIEIVHAHGRIPAFLCGILNRFVSFTFVTTAHWVFDTSHGLKYLSNWGEKVIAVSEDIKTYLMDNYHTNPADIYVTINGIDTNKFCKEADTANVIEEFSLSPDSKKIVYISRMDQDRAQVAFELVSVAPDIAEKVPDIEIVIVGGGNVLEMLKEQADEANKRIGRRAVILTGGRTDIDKFAALGDIFVGVSRSALEAMACEKPVIVAGNEGYIGIFDEAKLAVAIDTNFCCRGLAPSNPQKLLSDIFTLLQNSEEENARLGSFGRNLILESYSLARMAGDCVKMYRAAADEKKWDAVLSGYYGYENAGDESLLYAMLENLRAKKEDIRILVLSNNPEETEKTYGVHAQNRYNLRAVRKALKNSKLLIFGGGSLIQDVTSNKSLWYYLAVLKQAISLGVPVMLYANGIGPVEKKSNCKRVQKVLSRVDLISLRDDVSYSELQRLGISCDNVQVTADPALTIQGVDKAKAQALLQEAGVPENKKLLGISVRPWKLLNPAFFKQLAQGIEAICKAHDYVPVFLPLKHPEDIAISKEMAAHMNIKSYLLTKRFHAQEIVGVVGACDMIIAMRLHSLIYASAAAVPGIGLSYDPKISGFVDYIGVHTNLSLDNFSTEKLISAADSIAENQSAVLESLPQRVTELKACALKNADMAMELIEQFERREKV